MVGNSSYVYSNSINDPINVLVDDIETFLDNCSNYKTWLDYQDCGCPVGCRHILIDTPCLTWEEFLNCSISSSSVDSGCNVDQETQNQVIASCFECSNDKDTSFWCALDNIQKKLLAATSLTRRRQKYGQSLK